MLLLLQIHLTHQEFIIYALIIGISLGFLLGLIPLILGIRKKKTRLGVYGLIASIIGGAISSILSLVIVGVFIYLILKKPTNTEPVDVRVVNENSSDVKIDITENR